MKPYKTLRGLMKPYPSLSFGEYNSSHSRLFTPLVQKLAGRYLDPWDAGEGDPKNGPILGPFFGAVLGPILGPKIDLKFVNFWVQFWIPFFWGFGSLWVPLGSLLGPLEALLGGLWTQKPLKTLGFLRFLKMQLFGSLKLLMALLDSSWPLLGRSGPKIGPKMGPKSSPKSDQKVFKKWPQKLSNFGSQNGVQK